MERNTGGDKMTTEEAGNIYKETMDRIVAMQPEIPMRDWFAGLAMQGIVESQEPYLLYQIIARKSYEIADAMLKERDK
jgi:hypothetical protein